MPSETEFAKQRPHRFIRLIDQGFEGQLNYRTAKFAAPMIDKPVDRSRMPRQGLQIVRVRARTGEILEIARQASVHRIA